jgi:hypothetical protein
MFAQTAAVTGVRPMVSRKAGRAGKAGPVAALSGASVGLRKASSVDTLGRSQKTFQSTVAKQSYVKNGRATRVVTTAMFEVRSGVTRSGADDGGDGKSFRGREKPSHFVSRDREIADGNECRGCAL